MLLIKKTGIDMIANTTVFKKYCRFKINLHDLTSPAPNAGAMSDPVTRAKLVPID